MHVHATATSSSAPSSATPSATVVTTVVTQTVTNSPPPPAKPVIGSFGYGDLKLGMTRQQALDAKLKAEYTNLRPTGPNYTWVADADDNPAARFVFGVDKEKKTLSAAYLALDDQDCHN
ncbi:hypothetical protein ACIRG5_11865 [Lentzea sp. NPDC102401]|uniref:hypothetical protein n=1 Tax=Lentzea sp. NPDC102401 TaxID=3364128 RepID=UPI003825CD9E